MKPKFSLTKKSIIMLTVFAVFLIANATLISARVQANLIERQYKTDATDLSSTIAAVIDTQQLKRLRDKVAAIYDASSIKPTSDEWGSDDFNAYSAKFDALYEDEDYKSLLDFLRRIQSANNVDCVYVTYVNSADEHSIYIVDADEEEPCPIGCIDLVYDMNRAVLTKPEVGFPAYIISTETYGTLVTAGIPIFDTDGTVIGYAFSDIMMNDIRAEQTVYTLRLLLFLLLAAVVMTVIAVIVINKIIIKPIKKLSDSAYAYYSDESSIIREKFSSLHVQSHDEIRTLTDSMKKMENELNEHIAKLYSANNELLLSKDETLRMRELATKDALTGIRNKTAYDYELTKLDAKIESGDAKFGIAMIDLNFLKQTNDHLGHEYGDAALKKLSGVICSVFVHSPVFRIGGDEFTVILENNDYDKIDTLAEEFRAKIERIYTNDKLKPWERISAAIGYSLFDPKTDDDVGDVFRRADADMYEHKRYMKANGVVPLT